MVQQFHVTWFLCPKALSASENLQTADASAMSVCSDFLTQHLKRKAARGQRYVLVDLMISLLACLLVSKIHSALDSEEEALMRVSLHKQRTKQIQYPS